MTVPGVQARLTMLWLLCCAIPCGTIAALVGVRSQGVIIPQSASVEIPIVVIALAALLVGLPAMVLTSRSISQPINEVAGAMAKVQRGRTNESVGVYERSELGRLQAGFNDMVDGLAERDRVRDVFGRHVGLDVARRAIEEGVTLSGEVQEVAILFIDLVGSTTMAANNPPREVTEMLNRFFRIVVRAVDQHDGVINKFQGDAALAIFGAPLRMKSPARQALAAPVNEAARLADLAKTYPQRTLCSSDAIDGSNVTERHLWVAQGCIILRGRSNTTDVYAPVEDDGS